MQVKAESFSIFSACSNLDWAGFWRLRSGVADPSKPSVSKVMKEGLVITVCHSVDGCRP